MRGLLDVNVWIALLDDAHVFSARADSWLREADAFIATCPIVENGVIRIMSSPAYSQELRLTPGEVAAHLRKACAQLDHQFWPADLSLRDEKCFDFSRLHLNTPARGDRNMLCVGGIRVPFGRLGHRAMGQRADMPQLEG